MPKRCLLIIPPYMGDPRTGAGQRTALLFEALRQIAPTDVVMLANLSGEAPVVEDPNLRAAFFPGAEKVWRVRTNRYPAQTLRGLEWFGYNLRRFLFIDRIYAPEAALRQSLQRILSADHDVIAFRYALPCCISGLAPTPDRKIFVDIDDRDDQKYASAAEKKLPAGLPRLLFLRFILPRMRQALIDRLSHVSLLWYATEEDFLPVPAVPARLLRNVPFAEATEPLRDPAQNRDLLFVGIYGHRPNQDGMRWFLRNCWPEIHRRNPDSRLRIVGRGNWASLATEFPDLANVDYVGEVDTLQPEYNRARFTIAPVLEGGGSKIKVIESCAFSRLPVVSAHSARGFGEDITAALPQAPDAAEFIRLCDLYLKDDAALAEMTEKLHQLQVAQLSRASAETQIRKDILSVLPDPAG